MTALTPPMLTDRTGSEYSSLASCPNAAVSPASRSDPSPGPNGRPAAVSPRITASGPAWVMKSEGSQRGGRRAVSGQDAVAGSNSGSAGSFARGTPLAPTTRRPL